MEATPSSALSLRNKTRRGECISSDQGTLVRMASAVMLASLAMTPHLTSKVLSLSSDVDALAKYLPLKCPLHFLTGILCPTCGLARSLLAACLGHFHDSWRYHPIGFIIYLVSLVALVLFTIGQGGKMKAQFQLLKNHLKRERFLFIMLVLVYSAWGFGRNFYGIDQHNAHADISAPFK